MDSKAKTSGFAALVILFWVAAAPPRAESFPTMTFSTLFGTELWDTGNGVAVDAFGNTYMTGHVEGVWHDLADAFVLKVAPDGELVWSVRLGGSDWDEGIGVTVGAGGDVWVAGWTGSSDFPELAPWQPTDDGGSFLARLDAAGNLRFSTVFGGSGSTQSVEGIGSDGQGFVYLGGVTDSPDFPPGTGGAGYRSYVLKVDPAGPRIVWSFEVENPECFWRQLSGFTVDAAGHAYLGWYCHTGRLAASGSSLEYFVPVGSQGLAADTAGNAYLISSVSGRGDWSDVLVKRLGPDGSLTGSFSFGGSWDDWPAAIATGPGGEVYVAGETSSADFPLKDPVQPNCPNGEEWFSCWEIGFLTRIRPDTWEVVFSTYIGGGETVTNSDAEYTAPRAVAANGRSVAVAGWTADEDFTVFNAFQPTVAGSEDAFLVRVAFNQPPDCPAATASPSAIWPPNGRMVPVSILGVTDPDGDPVTLKILGIIHDETWSGPTASGIGSSVAQVKAERDGKGDGRVYHILFEATDPSGASCTGEVTVCVPHAQSKGKGSCVDGGAPVSSSSPG